MEKIYDYVDVPFEKETIDYGGTSRESESSKGLGDPIGVQQHDRPSTAHLLKWVEELGSDEAKRTMMEQIVGRLDPDDLALLGYPVDTLWTPLTEAGVVRRPKRAPLTRYRLQRRAIIRLRQMAGKPGIFRNMMLRIRLALDVLLRE